MVGEVLSSRRVEVGGRSASYSESGDGPPVVFLHGWAVGGRSYARAMRRLTRRGCHVFAPALPGFGGTAPLPAPSMSIAGYAAWVDEFMRVVGIDEPALVIGHSFGGGVATKLAHDHPERVGYLVLLNSVGGVTERPLWSWAVHFGRELLPTREGIDIVRAMRDDVVGNLTRNPLGLWRAGELARRADLREELHTLRERRLPVLALTADGDGVVPQGAFEALCGALGTEGRVVTGRHSWLLADPDSFDEVLGNVVEVRVSHHVAQVAPDRAAEIADALTGTSLTRRSARALVHDAPPLWLMSAPASVLAADVALCHPKLRPGELRAVARPIEGSHDVRFSVVAADRPGLLAATAGVLSAHGLAIEEASAVTWAKRGVALHALTLARGDAVPGEKWEQVGHDLRAMSHAAVAVAPPFAPRGRAVVTVDGHESERALVRVTAPDQRGLLAATCRWFAEHDLSIESLSATTDRNVARDVFIVTGPGDATGLRDFLNGRPAAKARVPALA